MRSEAVVHTTLQASAALCMLCAAVVYCGTKLEKPNVHFGSDILAPAYSRSTYMHIIRTCTIGRSTYIYVYSVLLCGSMSSLNSTSTLYFVRARYNISTAAAAAAAQQQQVAPVG